MHPDQIRCTVSSTVSGWHMRYIEKLTTSRNRRTGLFLFTGKNRFFVPISPISAVQTVRPYVLCVLPAVANPRSIRKTRFCRRHFLLLRRWENTSVEVEKTKQEASPPWYINTDCCRRAWKSRRAVMITTEILPKILRYRRRSPDTCGVSNYFHSPRPLDINRQFNIAYRTKFLSGRIFLITRKIPKKRVYDIYKYTFTKSLVIS